VTVEGENPLGLRVLVNPQTGWVTAGFRLPASEEGGVKRLAQANGLVVGDRIMGHFASLRGGQNRVVGLFGVAQQSQVEDPVVVDEDHNPDRQFVGNLTSVYAAAYQGNDGPYLYVKAQGTVPHAGYSDPALVVGSTGTFDFTVSKPVGDRIYLMAIQNAEAVACVPYMGQRSVAVRVSRDQVVEVPVQSFLPVEVNRDGGPTVTIPACPVLQTKPLVFDREVSVISSAR
jgi:hypothetical protein